MVKRILKIVGIVLASFVVVVGAAIGIYAWTGGFEDKTINITKLYFDDDATKTLKEIYTLEDITEKINFEPFDATNKELEVTIQDEVGVLQNPPTKLTAGEEFTLKINKDEKGNNIGGVVSVTIKQGIAQVSLKLLVDVALPDNVLYFSGNSNAPDSITTVGKNFTMAISNNEQNVYLKSELVNAFYLQSGTNNLKNAEISYDYYDMEGQKISSKTFEKSELTTERTYNALNNTYNYFYKIPVVPSQSGRIDISARMHRTYEIEEEYKANEFDKLESIIAVMNQSNTNKELANKKLQEYNAFINKYIKYFDITDDSYDFFKQYVNTSGVVNLTHSAVATSKDYVFLTCKATINITAVNLEALTSLREAKTYNVFDTVYYATSDISGIYTKNILNDFDLSIKISDETVSNVDAEKSNLFSTLEVRPYFYITKEMYDEDMGEGENATNAWEGYKKVNVYGFDGNSPITTSVGNPEIGYLMLLENSSEYIKVTKVNNLADGKDYWKIDFNVPLRENLSSIDITKALYLQFTVSGINLNDGTEIIKDAYTRIYIDYSDYVFKNQDVSRLTFNNLSTKMAINRSLNNASGYALDTQVISINTTSEYITNYDTVQYKSIMYFVEGTSNVIEGNVGPKIVSVGKYSFVNMLGSAYMFGDSNLIGQRIPTYNSNGQCYIQTINASSEPVKIFAVVYLSDRDGNPIDLNGRKIIINENAEDNIENQLIVVSISDISVTNINQFTIDNFVDNINFYTKALETQDIGGITFEAGNYIKRNQTLSYVDADGKPVPETTLEKIQEFLKLKLLKDYNFILYATNFELDTNGAIADENTKVQYSFNYYDKGVLKNLTFEFDKNTLENKQIAFNNMCSIDFNNNYTFVSGDNISVSSTILREDNAILTSNAQQIKFVIKANETPLSTDYFMISPATNTINQPYSTLLTSSDSFNRVMCEAHKIEIKDVIIAENVNTKPVSTYNKLYAKYSNNTDGSLEFYSYTVSNGSAVTATYRLPLEGENIGYTVINNLVSDSGEINKNYVDISQAIVNAMEGDENLDLNYKDLQSYIDYYVKNSNNTLVSYTNADRFIRLVQDLKFTNKNDNFIYIGANKYGFEPGFDASIELDGRIYMLTSVTDADNTTTYTLTINKGNYYPVVDNKAFILGEEFEIVEIDTNQFVIYSYNDGVERGLPYEVAFGLKLTNHNESYSANAYVKENNQGSSITKIVDSTDPTQNYATINFIKGEEIVDYQSDENGEYKFEDGNYVLIADGEEYLGNKYALKPIYVEDPNGNLVFKNGQYVDAKDDNSSTRYSKKGVQVFLMITFNMIPDENNSYEKTITKVFTYELVQENIEIRGINSNTANGIVYNSQSNELEINAGETTTIKLNTNESRSITTTAITETYFFNHVTFSIEGVESGLRFAVNGQKNTVVNPTKGISSLELYVPDAIADNSAIIKMSYMFKGEQKTEYFYIKIKANMSFDTLANADIVKENNNYKIKLNDSTDYSIANDIIAEYFTSSSNITSVKLTPVNTNYCTVEGDTLKIAKSYGVYENNTITKDNIELSITLVKDNGAEITLNKKLIIEIIPTYTIDTTALEGDAKVFDNSHLFIDYIKLYNGTDKDSLVSNLDTYKGVFKIYQLIYTEDIDGEYIFTDGKYTKDIPNGYSGVKYIQTKTLCTNGIIQLPKTPVINTKIGVVIEYSDGRANSINTTYEYTITIKGINMYYSETGEALSVDTSEMVVFNSNITIITNSDIDLNDYFKFVMSDLSDVTSIYAVIDNAGVSTTEITSAGTYNIMYAIHNGTDYVIIGDTGYDFIVTTA